MIAVNGEKKSATQGFKCNVDTPLSRSPIIRLGKY